MRGLNFASGLAFGAVIAFGVASLIEADLSANAATLWAGGLAFLGTIAAGWTAWAAAQSQITEQKTTAERQRRARLEAERAALPDALRRITEHCDSRVKMLVMGRVTDGPQADTSAVSVLKACIEHSNVTAKTALVDLLHVYGACVLGDYYLVASNHPKIPSLPNVLHLAHPPQSEAENRLELVCFWLSVKARVASLEDFSVGMIESAINDDMAVIFRRELERLSCDGFPITSSPGYASVFSRIAPTGVHFLCEPDWRRRWLEKVAQKPLRAGRGTAGTAG